MNINEEVMQRFYSAFARLDHKVMQDCYTNDAIFNDPVFGILQGDEIKVMWEMLCKNAKDFSLDFNSIESDDEYGTCNWIASYTFSKTGRKVVNKIKAHMRFRDGKIIEHTDEFDLYKWSRQALGIIRGFLGWSGYLKNKIQSNARKNLGAFISLER